MPNTPLVPDIENYFDLLVTKTVRNAARMPFYRDRWSANAASKVISAADLARLPVISRSDVQVAEGRGFAEIPDNVLIHHTKGSSGSGLLYRFRTPDEIRFLSDFYSRVNGPAQATDLFLLQESDAYHGASIPMPFSGMVIPVSSDRKGIDHFADIVGRPFPTGGRERSVNAFSGTPAFLFLATLNLLRLGRRPVDCGFVALATSGGFLSNWRRNFLQQVWGCPVIDNFSLSEVFASAVRVGESFMFRPTVIAEFLDPVTYRPIEEGLAILTLTELYPFISAQPLIRYDTGDLVQVSRSDTPWMRPFVPQGRYERSIRDHAGQVLLTEHAWIEALEETPGLVWTQHHLWVRELFGLVPMDRPHVQLTAVENALSVAVETVYSPLTESTRAAAIAATLRDLLLAKAPRLSELVQQDRWSVEVTPRVSVPPENFDY